MLLGTVAVATALTPMLASGNPRGATFKMVPLVSGAGVVLLTVLKVPNLSCVILVLVSRLNVVWGLGQVN